MSTSAPPSPARLRVLLPAGLVVIVAVALAGWLLRSDGAPETGRPDLQRILDSAVTGGNRLAPGAVAYVSGPRGTWIGAAGVADVTTGEPMRSDARMRLESISKIYTATLILQLAEQGRG